MKIAKVKINPLDMNRQMARTIAYSIGITDEIAVEEISCNEQMINDCICLIRDYVKKMA